MSDSPVQLSLQNNECNNNTRMGAVQRSGSYNGTLMASSVAIDATQQYQQQELGVYNSSNIFSSLGNFKPPGVNNSDTNYTYEQIACICEDLLQRKDIPKLDRFVR